MLEGAGGGLIDVPARPLAAGEGDLRHLRMLDQRIADLGAEAGDDIDDARRESRLLEERGELERRGRGEFRGLQHDRVAGGERGRELEGGQQQRRVPRRDADDDAERLGAREVEHLVLVGRDDRAFDLVGEPAEVIVPLRRVADLARHLRVELAVVARLGFGEALGLDRDEIAEPAHELAALARLHRPPRPLAKGLVRRFDRALGVGRPAARDERPGLARIGIEAFEGFAAGGVHPFAADEAAITLELGHARSPPRTGRSYRGRAGPCIPAGPSDPGAIRFR